MKRIVTVVAAIGLVAGACGSSDGDKPAAEDTATTVVAGANDEAADTAADDAAASEESADGATADDATTNDGSGDTGGSGATIRSINDIPKVCRDAMADFLRAIEPVVSDIDWENGTMAEFTAVFDENESLFDDFDARSAAEGCEDLNFEDDDSNFDLLIEFANDEAPGTVGFFEFLQSLGDSSVGGGDSADDSASGGEIGTCDEAIAFMQNLIDTYGSMSDVPMSELLTFSEVNATAYTTCTPAQLEFFNSDEFTAFVSE